MSFIGGAFSPLSVGLLSFLFFCYFSIFPSDRIISPLASGVQVIAPSWEWSGNVFQAEFCRGEVKAFKHIETASAAQSRFAAFYDEWS